MSLIIPFKLKIQQSSRPCATLVIFIFFVSGAFAQEVYDIERCIQTGLEHNFNLRVVHNNEAIADNNYSKGNAGMLPVVTLSNRFGGTLNTTSQHYEDGSKVAAPYKNDNTGSAAMTMGMTIFRGFEVQTRYRELGEQAKLEGLKTQMAIENLVAAIVAEYNNYLQQMTLYDNLAYAVTLSRERVRIDEQRYLLGSASRMQLLQSIVYLNADSSRYARQNEVLRASQISLNELMATDDPGEAFLLSDDRITVDTTLDYDALLALALENNTSLQIASKNRIISEMDYKIIRSEIYPYLSLTSGYGYNYNGYGASELLNQQTHGLNYGLTLGWDIFDGLNKKREQSNARIGIESSQIRYEEVEQSVKADLLTIYYAYENNLQIMRLEEQNLKVAQENLEIALERYKLGSLAGLELREVQKSLLDAEERLISVKYQIKLAEISLYQLAGGIMNYL
jgi:adhesin transport system outer membrane protein